ncbi:integrase core domain-containing protein, partial [Escherichia coli]
HWSTSKTPSYTKSVSWQHHLSSPQSNGMAERLVKTMKEDYIAFMPKPNIRTALHNLAVAIEHYNENHPHSALGYRSPREYRRQRVTLT